MASSASPETPLPAAASQGARATPEMAPPEQAAPSEPAALSFSDFSAEETRPFDVIVSRTANKCLRDFADLVTDCAAGACGPGKADVSQGSPFVPAGPLDETQRKLGLLRFIHCSRQRLLRLLVIAKWSSQLPIIDRCRQVSGTLANHDASFTQAADALFGLHAHLSTLRTPMYDVASAAEVLSQRTYSRLPTVVGALRREEEDARNLLEGADLGGEGENCKNDKDENSDESAGEGEDASHFKGEDERRASGETPKWQVGAGKKNDQGGGRPGCSPVVEASGNPTSASVF